jgi:hypothetical protein
MVRCWSPHISVDMSSLAPHRYDCVVTFAIFPVMPYFFVTFQPRCATGHNGGSKSHLIVDGL